MVITLNGNASTEVRCCGIPDEQPNYVWRAVAPTGCVMKLAVKKAGLK